MVQGCARTTILLKKLYLVDPGDAIAGGVSLLVLLCALSDHGSYNHDLVAYNGRISDRLDRIEPCVLCIHRTLDARFCCFGSSFRSSSSGDVSSAFLLTLSCPEGWQREILSL